MGILSWTNNEYEWKHIDISWEGKNMIQLGGSQVAIHFGALRIEKASCDCMLPLGISDGQQRGHTHTHPPFAGWSTKLSGPKPQTKHDASWHLGIEAKAVTLTEPDRNVDVFSSQAKWWDYYCETLGTVSPGWIKLWPQSMTLKNFGTCYRVHE